MRKANEILNGIEYNTQNRIEYIKNGWNGMQKKEKHSFFSNASFISSPNNIIFIINFVCKNNSFLLHSEWNENRKKEGIQKIRFMNFLLLLLFESLTRKRSFILILDSWYIPSLTIDFPINKSIKSITYRSMNRNSSNGVWKSG